MKQIRAILIFCVLVLSNPGLGSPALAEPVRVWAAASLRDVLQAAVTASGQDVLMSVAGSNTVARHVSQGAPADLVILANTDWMNWLIDQGAVHRGQVKMVAGNRLVLAGPEGSAPIETPDATTLLERLGNGRLAVGMVKGVPAGIYAREWMQQAGLWDVLAPRLAETENVRAALALLVHGEVPLAIVYASDIHKARDVDTVYEIPQDADRPIAYPMAALTARGEAFAAFLTSAEGQALFEDYGFAPAPETR